MLVALPAIKQTLGSDANGYFGSHGPGLAVGLVLDDGLYYSQGFGFADGLETRVPDENTIFRAGSVSKVMTGTGLLTLRDAGKLQLGDFADDDHLLPELKFVCPKFNQPCDRGSQNHVITLANLVSHTSGLANVMEQTNAHVPAWLSDLKKSWLLFKPGDFSAYSGVGVEGVGLIEQRVSGQSYVEFIRNNLFAPLGMQNSSMDQTTLPQQSLAQKWSWAATFPTTPCLQGCTTDEGQCMSQAHSFSDRQACVKAQLSCTAHCPAVKPTWFFSQFNQIIPGDDQPMIAPAGGLATTVADMSLFIKMWLSGTAPLVNGQPLLKGDTISLAANSLFKSDTPPPAGCNAVVQDANGFFYSACGTANIFGVNWAVNDVPYIEHNGDDGVSGSNTRIDQPGKMAATGLVSTEPYPQFQPQPAGLDPHFIDTVVYGLLNAGLSADAATSWTGQTLADGVARVLYLSGKTPETSDLNVFTSAFIAGNHLTDSNIVSFLDTWHSQVGTCSTFRVRDVRSSNQIEIVLPCKHATWDTVLEVEEQEPHRISWSKLVNEKCVESCGAAEGQCMSQAHSSSDRQACVQQQLSCTAACN